MITITYTTAAIIAIAVVGALITSFFYAIMKENENNGLRSKNRALQQEIRRLKHSAPMLGYDAATGTHYIADEWRDCV